MADPLHQHSSTTSRADRSEAQPLLENDDERQSHDRQASESSKGRSLHTRVALKICLAIYIIVTLVMGLYLLVSKALASIGPIGTYPTTTYFFVDPTPVSSIPSWSVPPPDLTWVAEGPYLRNSATLTFVKVSSHTPAQCR